MEHIKHKRFKEVELHEMMSWLNDKNIKGNIITRFSSGNGIFSIIYF